jgi:hypothetical protein
VEFALLVLQYKKEPSEQNDNKTRQGRGKYERPFQDERSPGAERLLSLEAIPHFEQDFKLKLTPCAGLDVSDDRFFFPQFSLFLKGINE